MAGAAVGAIAGPLGMVAGGALGGLVGTMAGGAIADAEARRSQHDDELDHAIGVNGGDIGAAKRGQPPARIGAYSSGSSGTGGSHDTVSSGPIQDLDEE